MFALAILIGILSLVAGQNLVYYCGFETDLCGLNGDANAWIRYNIKTPSTDTGPASAYNGSYFVYFESSDPNYTNSTSLPLSLTLPVGISLTAVRLRYALHAYGSSIQSFNVLIYSSNNALLKNDQILSTQLQISSNDPWKIMDNTYSFGSVIKRIDFVVTTFKWLADIAIDDLAVYSVGCGVCSINGQCQNTANGQQCVCSSGYTGDGYTCLLDPCSSCSVNAQCVTTNGVRQCVCNIGFVGNGNTCSVDPCSSCGVNAQCATNNGVRQCVCNNGFIGNGITCSVDPCSSCSVNAQCVVTNGVRQCACNNGFIGNGNTCSVDPCSSCSVNAQCVVTNGVRQCACNNGFIGNGITCTASDPCSSCSVNAQCVTTSGVRQCVCNNGFIGNGNTCSVDPCNSCSVNAQCVTINGVRQCACNNGFIGNGITCTVDPCSSCSVNAQCVTTNGVRQCVCNSGFIGNGNTCSVDPCISCSANAQCVTNNGVRQCVCNNGFVGNGNTCSVSTLCGSVLCSPYADCVTEFGLPVCRCRPGYVCGGQCVTQGFCANFATCSVVNGLETCTCAPEYYGDGLSAPGSTGCRSKCEQAACPMYSSCTLNSAFVASCSCNPNFVWSNGACVDVNECLTVGWCRGENTYCLNNIGGYTCECQPNYLVNAATSGRDRSCQTFQSCTIGKTCNCATVSNPTSVPLITFFFGVNSANPATALQYLDIWSDVNVKAYCAATGCDQSMLGDIISNITIYVRRAEEMMNNSMAAMQKVREYIDCNSYEALEPAWWNLYDTLSSQFLIFKQVRRDLDMKLTFMMEESKRCETTNADWFRKYLEWLSPVKY